MVMEELYTKSVSRALGTLIINDNTTEYAGEPFDRALTNVFRALDYVFLDDRENALVEARKVTEYLTELAAAGNGKSGYRDDAFAQYLSGMLKPEELTSVQLGIADAATGVKAQIPVDDYRVKITDYIQEKQSARAVIEKKKGDEYAAKAAAETGAVKLSSGIIVIPVTEGTGAYPTASDMFTARCSTITAIS